MCISWTIKNRYHHLGCTKTLEISWPAERLLYSQRLSWRESVGTNHMKTWVSYFCNHFPTNSRIQKGTLPTANILYWIHNHVTNEVTCSLTPPLCVDNRLWRKEVTPYHTCTNVLLSYADFLVNTTHVTAHTHTHTPPRLRTEAKIPFL